MVDLQEKSIELWRKEAWKEHARLRKAENRIEQLEAVLRDLSDGWECCPVSKAMRSVARIALEGKDEDD